MMAKFKWRKNGKGLGQTSTEYVLSVQTKTSSRWYATIRYLDDKKQWHLIMCNWETWHQWAPIAFTDIRKPPKEYVENLVLLAHDTGVNDG